VQCPACQENVAIWAAYCPHCGASLTQSADLSVDDDAADAELSLTSELFGGREAPQGGDTVEDPSAAPGGEPAAYEESYGVHERKRASGATALMVAAALIVAAALGFATWSIFRVGSADEASNSPTSSTTTSPRPSVRGTSAAPTTPAPSSSAPGASPTPSDTADSGVPAGAIACGVTGDGDTAAVYSANANTSCPFAQEVANVYRASGGASQITARSPVTGKDYVMTCSGTLPTTCVADTGATVYLTKG